ncbi:MAG: hypothetical protein ABI353_03490, partial [Isosphaeraceae bacterium]
MNHCVAKILELVARGVDDRRALLQLGYNLGRLSELTGLGREPFWDRWKEAVACWDRAELDALARQLQAESVAWTERPAEGMAA